MECQASIVCISKSAVYLQQSSSSHEPAQNLYGSALSQYGFSVESRVKEFLRSKIHTTFMSHFMCQ